MTEAGAGFAGFIVPDEGLRTDKMSLGYYPAYKELADRIGPAGHVLEVGVAFGGSLMLWQRLFPGGVVAGADNDPAATWPEGTVRIAADQDSPALPEAAWAASPGGWDLIVDDASHHGTLTERTFTLLWPLVKPGGWYVIEDWPVAYIEPYASTGAYGGDSMLTLVQSFVPRLEPAPGAHDYSGAVAPSAGSGISELWYRFGQAMIHKAGP